MMARWRWALVALIAAGNLIAFWPLITREPQIACEPEMAVPAGLFAPVAGRSGMVHELSGVRATWHLSGPDSLSNAGLEVAGETLPWTAEHVRRLCTDGMPCALKIDAPERFALLYVEPSEAGPVGAMIVQDAPDRRLVLNAAPGETPADASCAALAAWFAFARQVLPG